MLMTKKMAPRDAAYPPWETANAGMHSAPNPMGWAAPERHRVAPCNGLRPRAGYPRTPPRRTKRNGRHLSVTGLLRAMGCGTVPATRARLRTEPSGKGGT